jgi:putative chitinase
MTVERTAYLLEAIGVTPAAIAGWSGSLFDAMGEFEVRGRLRECMFLATVCHESANLKHLVENLNYSAAGLAKTWPSRFCQADGYSPNAKAWSLARNPEAIADEVYANRMGNGPPESGDGWRYRGRGPIQLTGRDNYRARGEALGLNLKGDPQMVLDPKVGALTAALHWRAAGCNEAADTGNFDHVSDRINRGRETPAYGDSIGWSARLAVFQTALDAYDAFGMLTAPCGTPALDVK